MAPFFPLVEQLPHVFLLDYYDNMILLLFIVAYKVNEVSQYRIF